MDLRRVDLNLLVALDILLSERSVTRAAARLSVGQSAMSATLARLRLLFADPLLTREGRELIPTPVAESMIVPLRECLVSVGAVFRTRAQFNPETDHRSFTLMASDYATLVFLHPLLLRLEREAPHVLLKVRPVIDDFSDQLRRNQVDLLVMPREVFPQIGEFPNTPLYSDRYVCVFDANNPDIGEDFSLEQFRKQPYLATTSSGRARSLADIQLDELGVDRATAITTGFMLAFLMLRGTRMFSMTQERSAKALMKRLDLRIAEPPISLRPVHHSMIWTARNSDDAGHKWLRQRMQDLAQELFGG